MMWIQLRIEFYHCTNVVQMADGMAKIYDGTAQYFNGFYTPFHFAIGTRILLANKPMWTAYHFI